MKELYNSRMKEYVTELTFISEKLQKYDEILTRKLILENIYILESKNRVF
jgi:kinesin family protein 6/9